MQKFTLQIPVQIEVQHLNGDELAAALDHDLRQAFATGINGHAIMGRRQAFLFAEAIGRELRTRHIDTSRVSNFVRTTHDHVFVTVDVFYKD